MAARRRRRHAPPTPSPPPPPPPPPAAAALVGWDELPAWRRDNAFIRSGYRRPRASYTHALASLFYLHNESVNIWTHLAGALAAALLALLAAAPLCRWCAAARLAAAAPADAAALACFLAGAVACLAMSAAYHALADHSEAVARWGNKLDYTGIIVLIVGSYVPALHYGFACRPALRAPYLTLIAVLGAACAVVSWVERFRTPAWRPWRAAMFVGLGLSGVVPVVHGLALYGYAELDERMSLSWVLAQGALYIFGAVLYAARWPERWAPGVFDIWGSSHQLFHVFVLLAAATHLHGMTKAFDYHHAGLACVEAR